MRIINAIHITWLRMCAAAIDADLSLYAHHGLIDGDQITSWRNERAAIWCKISMLRDAK